MNISRQDFGKLRSGEHIEIITLVNDRGIEVSILTLGGIIQAVKTPDEDGHFKDIVLGYDDIQGYEKDPYYMGAIVGPVAGRISYAQFPLYSKIHQLEANADEHHLHGGSAGLNFKIWEADVFKRQDSVKAVLRAHANDGEGGYPGNRTFKTTYILNNKNQLMIYFDAETDADTIVNMTSHSYFNLSAQENDGIGEHLVMINALKTLAVDEKLIPNGNFDYVLGKATNFSRGKTLKEALSQQEDGFDHVYILNKEMGKFGISAKVVHQQSGRVLEVVTNQPALVFYTNNHSDGATLGKKTQPILKHGSFCLEAQQLADAPNHSNFPSILIKAGETYKSRTQLTFGLASETHHH